MREGTFGRSTRPPNKELKLTKPGAIGASQLNSSVRRLVRERRGLVSRTFNEHSVGVAHVA